jgi:uncharacterized membrane-anchored protein YitT (DUF2179 family)
MLGEPPMQGQSPMLREPLMHGEPAMRRGRSRHWARLQQFGADPMGSRLKEYAYLIIGCFIVAISFNVLLAPNDIASGGVQGISIVTRALFNAPLAATQWAINILLFIAGTRMLGGHYGIKTAVGTVLMPLFVLITSTWPPLTDQQLLAAIFGGFGVGAGLGIVFRGRGSTGGLDLAAQMLARGTGWGLGVSVAILDGGVILTAGIVLGAERALYALIGLYVTKQAIDAVQLGLGHAKVAYIISGNMDRITHAILYELDRGLTKLSAHGGFTGEERTVLMVVVPHTEVTRLKTFIRSVDPNAFVIITRATEVLGEGFKAE